MDPASNAVYFSRFYGGVYKLNVAANSTVTQVQKSRYGTFGLALGRSSTAIDGGLSLYWTQTNAEPPGVSLDGDVMEFDIASAASRTVCRACASGSDLSVARRG